METTIEGSIVPKRIDPLDYFQEKIAPPPPVPDNFLVLEEEPSKRMELASMDLATSSNFLGMVFCAPGLWSNSPNPFWRTRLTLSSWLKSRARVFFKALPILQSLEYPVFPELKPELTIYLEANDERSEKSVVVRFEQDKVLMFFLDRCGKIAYAFIQIKDPVAINQLQAIFASETVVVFKEHKFY